MKLVHKIKRYGQEIKNLQINNEISFGQIVYSSKVCRIALNIDVHTSPANITSLQHR